MSDQDDAFANDFFVAGGTLRSGAASYVSRPADRELLAATLAGDFCYVLTPRQMGKSSLMVRTARRLQADGVRTVILEQWYLGLLSRVNARLDRTFDLAAWWGARAHLGVVQRFTDYLREMMLQVDARVVIFIDEIDTTLSLDFRDDFFAAIRYFYNMRSDEPGLERLSIVLLGVATPADLIRDRTRTPFNIGHRIDLLEFSRDDARLLERGLEAVYPTHGVAIFERIYGWTNGHPYLTQKLCLAASEDEVCANSPERVDDLVHDLFLSESARRETNLQFIRDNIMGRPPDERRRIVSLYRDVRRNRNVAEDERSPAQNRLKLIGLVKGEGGALRVRNQVYRTVFDETWIKESMPVDWNRRIAVGALLAVLLMAIGLGAFLWNSRRQTTERLISEQSALFESGNPSVRLTSLAALYDGGAAESVAAADELLATLPPADRLALFDSGTVAGLDGPLGIVAGAMAARQTNDTEGTALLAAMAAALTASDNDGNVLLGRGFEQWVAARAHGEAGDFQSALSDLNDAQQLMTRSPSPALFFDLGVAHNAAGNLDEALIELGLVVDSAEYPSEATRATLPQWGERVAAFVSGEPALLGRWWPNRESFNLSLAAVLPSPTATPLPTVTPSRTLTPAVSPTPSRTPTRTPQASSSTPTPSLGLAAPMLVVSRDTNLRVGPGAVFRATGVATEGSELEIIGRDPSELWFNVLSATGQPAWIAAADVSLLVELADIPIAATIPARPSATRAPTATPTLPPALPTATLAPPPENNEPAPTATRPPEPPPTEADRYSADTDAVAELRFILLS